MTSQKQPLSRREFLQRAAVLGALSVGGAQLLIACEREPARQNGQAPSTPPEPAPLADSQAQEAALSCDDVSDLNEAQIQARNTNEYVDQTPNPEQTCDNCALFTEPSAPGQCGGCTVVPGPIHPKGWCKVWVPKPA